MIERDFAHPPITAKLFKVAAAAVCCTVFISLTESLPSFAGPPDITMAALFVAAILFAAASFTGAVAGTGGAERVFWALLGLGALMHFVGDPLWSVPREASGEAPILASHAVSYSLLFGALFMALFRLSPRVRLLSVIDVLASTASMTLLLVYFVSTPQEAASAMGGWTTALSTLLRPGLAVGVLHLSLILLSLDHSPSFVPAAAAGFAVFFFAEAISVADVDPRGLSEPGFPAQALWIAGLVSLSLAARRAEPDALARQSLELGVSPVRHTSFWFGPLAPTTHLAVIFGWGMLHRPIPDYVLVTAMVVMAYVALRFSLFSFSVYHLRLERDAALLKLEQRRISAGLHDTAKQHATAASRTLSTFKTLFERGDFDRAEEVLDVAVESVRRAQRDISKPVDELRLFAEIDTSSEDGLMRILLGSPKADFQSAWPLEVHAEGLNLLADLPEHYRQPIALIGAEAAHNAAKHSGARNLWLSCRRESDEFALEIRDDGSGFSPNDEDPGSGRRIMRERAAGIGAALSVEAVKGDGTCVKLVLGGVR